MENDNHIYNEGIQLTLSKPDSLGTNSTAVRLRERVSLQTIRRDSAEISQPIITACLTEVSASRELPAVVIS